MFSSTITKGNVTFLGVAKTQGEADGMAIQSMIANIGEGSAYDVIAGNPTGEDAVEDFTPIFIIDGDRMGDEEFMRELSIFLNSIEWDLDIDN